MSQAGGAAPPPSAADEAAPAAARAEEGVAAPDATEARDEAAPVPPPPPPLPSLVRFWRKFHGDPAAPPRPLRPPALEAAYAAVAGGVAIAVLAGIHVVSVAHQPRALEQLVAPLAASTVLVFATPTSPLAQPRNVFFGNVFSALVGCIVEVIFRGHASLDWLASGLAVGGAILVMALTGSIHPPAGAMALTALARDPAGQPHTFLFVAMPAATGSVLLIAMALIFNNLHPLQKYPARWW